MANQICRDLMTGEAMSHSFCKVQRWWSTTRSRACPVCKAVPPRANTPPRDLCEAFLLEVESGLVCRLHTDRLKLFCLDHRAGVWCAGTPTSAPATGRPRARSGAAAQRRPAGAPGASAGESEVKVKWEEKDEDIKTQAEDTERKIKEGFTALRAFLRAEEEEQKRQRMKDKSSCLTGEITALESTISNIEKGLAEEDASLLVKASGLSTEAQRPLPAGPQQLSGAPINVPANTSFAVWAKMADKVSYTPVILNPNTAHEELHLSECPATVRCGPSPERMEQHRSVLGLKGYSSGRRAWVVEVGDSPGGLWVAEDAQRTEDILSGLWMVMHTFTHTFTSKLVPYINTWSEIPLRILPPRLSVTPITSGDQELIRD
ncbi:E3 ubiquitin-protein ligase TRIM35-like [Trachinotus anak]|uniref:E3 ubiquitin-protein ligase TRIM35-like n=1 Tax=Trachinotus anak TaxID=443729 RepID=UPI0039F1C379